MTTKTEKFMTDLFQQAAENYKVALETGAKAQEEITQWWTKTLSEAGSMEEWQNRMQSIAGGSIPLAQKNAEEGLKLMQKNMQSSLDLLRQAFETGQSESVAEIQHKTRDLWEASLKAMRQNTEAVVKANAQAISAWSDLVTHGNGKAKATVA